MPCDPLQKAAPRGKRVAGRSAHLGMEAASQEKESHRDTAVLRGFAGEKLQVTAVQEEG